MDSCEDQLSRESGRMKLSDLNEAWGSCLGDLSDREEQLKGALERAEKYQVMQPTTCVMDLHVYGVRYANSLNIYIYRVLPRIFLRCQAHPFHEYPSSPYLQSGFTEFVYCYGQ